MAEVKIMTERTFSTLEPKGEVAVAPRPEGGPNVTRVEEHEGQRIGRMNSE